MTTKVVYIAGAGRSGSTFLSQLLSQNPDCMNVGQIRHLAMSYGRKRLCSCGKALPDCTYWGKVAAGLVEKYGPQAIDALKTGFDNFQHASDAFENWGDSAARAALATQQAGFLTMLGDLRQILGLRPQLSRKKFTTTGAFVNALLAEWP